MRINHWKRRGFITLLSGAAITWPLAARAQQPAVPVIGYLSSLTQTDSVHFDAAFRRGLTLATRTSGLTSISSTAGLWIVP
jgi:putative tryptophan/tyrosine transport system substrate-binding protein